MEWEYVVPIVVALVATIPGILGYRKSMSSARAQDEKTEADAADVIASAAKSLVEPLRVRVLELEGKVKQMEDNEDKRTVQFQQMKTELSEMSRDMGILCEIVTRLLLQIRSLGAIPVATIPDGLCDKMNGKS